MATTRTPARNFFLNERHELDPGEKPGGGRAPQLGAINWPSKVANLRRGFARIRQSADTSKDPVSQNRFFLTASPARIPRFRKTKGQREDFEEPVDFRDSRSADLVRLGLDVLTVAKDGRALVHAPAARFAVLERTAASLLDEQDRVRNRWLALDAIDVPDWTWRVDRDWLTTLKNGPVDCIVELAPVLARSEAESVMSAILGGHLRDSRVLAAGNDYSGRSWWRAKLGRGAIQQIATDFPSVQLLHPPYTTALAHSIGENVTLQVQPRIASPPPVASLPVVGVVDCGITEYHPVLAPYRVGRWTAPNAISPGHQHHAAGVASRVVFGRVDRLDSSPVVGSCAFIDIATAMKPVPGSHDAQIDDKDILTSMAGVLGTTNALRTFVCPFDTRLPVDLLHKSERDEKLRLVRDLDNFIATNDVIVVVSAGNVRLEVKPHRPYPLHFDDPNWQLGPWASAHNTLTCGGFLGSDEESEVSKFVGSPSPFTRSGPGFALATAVPDAADHAGGELGGAIVLDEAGRWLSKAGTSYAAPLLAREAARSFVELARYCPADGRPSSSLVKAFLALTAHRIGSDLSPAFRPLVKRTLGCGRMSAERLLKPTRESALFLWQGVIEGPDDIVRVLLPLPRTWIERAGQPTLRLVTSWNSYVNDSASSLWSCRRVEVQLRVGQSGGESLHSAPEHLGATYPRSVRTYDLGKAKAKIQDDELVVCISYKTEGMAPMLSFVVAGPEQIVAFGAELFDASDDTSPYEEVVKLESRIGVMDRLRAAAIPVRIGVRS